MAEPEGAVPGFGAPGDNSRIPTAEELLAAIESMSELSEENKQELRESILRGGLAKEAAGKFADAVGEQGRGSGEMVILFVLISLVLMVLVFFGYKLYSSLMEKERRREEKKKQKQQKKKK